MGKTRRLTLSSKEFIPEHEIFSNKPYRTYFLKIEVDIDDCFVDLTYRKEKDEIRNVHKQHNYIYFDTNEEKLIELFNFLTNDMPETSGQNIHIDIPTKEGILKNQNKTKGLESRKTEKEYQIGTLRFDACWNRIIVETFEGQNPIIPYFEVEHSNEPQDRKNLKELKSFSRDVLSEFSNEEEIELEPLPTGIEDHLQTIEWGEEVLSHLNDGDQCLREGLTHPALTSYIHAIEWSMIAYLKSEENIDIIQREKSGRNYYFAANEHNLLDELTKHKDITQKTESKIRNMNYAERRWAAHHKDGETTVSDTESVRDRLIILLKELFS